jgi:hypothetical protein
MMNFNDKAQKPTAVQEKKTTTISLLINSVYFFIGCVFIVDLHDHYRLVAVHNGRLLTDASYETLRGARIAFSKLYRNKAWKEGIKAQWSPFYDPDIRWLEEKTKDIKISISKPPIDFIR